MTLVATRDPRALHRSLVAHAARRSGFSERMLMILGIAVSFCGGLIHAAVGNAGGGARPLKRSGCAA